MTYEKYWEEIYKQNDKLNSLVTSYWNDYSNLSTWQFWVVLALLVVPLIILYIKVDRKRILELFFFGYTVNILWTFSDLALEKYGYFVHTFYLTPTFPFSLNMTFSALPVAFIFVYQYCKNHNKNFYIFTILISALFAFVLAAVEQAFGLSVFRKGMNNLYLFLIDLIIVFTSYWFTKLVLNMKGSE